MTLTKIYNLLQKAIEQKYHRDTYIVRQKAYVFIHLMTLWIISEIISLLFNSFSTRQATPAVMIFFNLFSITCGLFVIIACFKGYYKIAANAACILFFAGVTAFSLFRMDFYFQYGVNPALVLFFLVLAFSSFFADNRIFVLISIPVFIYHIVLIVLGIFYVDNQMASQFYSYSMNSSITISGIILFLYLSSMITNLALEKTDVELAKNRDLTKTLEEKVSLRTEDLASALRELESAHESLTRTKNALWGEMKIAKKLQMMLLPENPSIGGFACTAYIKPAADVGGDYYDIINSKDSDWVVIGDVSGHGVPAGLVMMMIHTSLHTIIQNSEDLNPAAVLSQVNSVVSEYMNR
ncbi:MAG: PP2C family protein-serine/threonine phosphatase, partial [Spirochaetota bacterium]